MQREAPALQNVNGSATPAPPQAPQFPAQFTQQMAMLFNKWQETCQHKLKCKTQQHNHSPLAWQYEKLMKFGATEFKGTVDSLEAEQWLERMEWVFRKLKCAKELKFEYSVSLLQGDAYE